MNDNRVTQLAGELLDVVSEAELDALLGGLVAEAGGRLAPPVRHALIGDLRRTAERTLPTLSVALGPRALPPARAAVETAARTFSVELEGMSAEDRDFEIAQRFVRFAEAAARSAA